MRTDPLTSAVRRALKDAPCSMRALAREAGISHANLVRIIAGSRPATQGVADAVASALRTWGERCSRLADAVESVPKSDQRGD